MFDKSDVEFSEKINTTTLDKECKKLLADNKIKANKTIKQKCNYSKLQKYDLVLNGHTHGKLYDKPFSTVSGMNTTLPRLVRQEAFIYEIDFVKNYIIQHTIPLKNAKNNSLKTSKKLYTFNDKEFIQQIKSKYDIGSVYTDIKHNDDSFVEYDNDESIDKVLQSIDIEKDSEEEIINKITNIKLGKSTLIKDPFILKNTLHEYLALKQRATWVQKNSAKKPQFDKKA